MNTARLNKNGQISIPADIRRKLKLKTGDDLGIDLCEDGKLVLQPIAIVPREEAYFHTPEIRKRIRKAEGELESGKGKSFATIDEALRWLKS